MTWLCVACSVGGVVALAAFLGIAFMIAFDEAKWLLVILTTLFVAGIAACSVENRVCELAGFSDED